MSKHVSVSKPYILSCFGFEGCSSTSRESKCKKRHQLLVKRDHLLYQIAKHGDPIGSSCLKAMSLGFYRVWLRVRHIKCF